jgi:hypothetical protein
MSDSHTPSESPASPPVSPADPFVFFPSTVIHLQSRGTLTLPPTFRPTDPTDPVPRIWLRLGPDDTWILERLWPPTTLFTRYDPQVAPEAPPPSPDPLPTRWLNVTTVLQAQRDPQHPARGWCQACDDGFHAVQMDPIVIPALLDALPNLVPVLDRPARARYVASVCSWTGVTLADRSFYLAVLAVWAHCDASWAALVQRARDT